MKSFKTPEGLEFPLVQLQGKDYLNVCYRVAWFRHKHPLWQIQTERMSDNGKLVTYRATVSCPSSEIQNKDIIVATAEKTTIIKAPTDYEKCETGAIGRALSFAGFGTAQGDIDEGDMVDASVNLKVLDPAANPEPSPFDNEDPWQEHRDNLKKFNEAITKTDDAIRETIVNAKKSYIPASDDGNKTFVGTKFAGDTFQKVYDNKRTAAIDYVDTFIPTLTEPSEQLRRFKQYVDWRRSQEKK